MPFTALHPDIGRVLATRASTTLWKEIEHSPLLTCPDPDCAARVVSVSPSDGRRRHFRHHVVPAPGTCAWSGLTAQESDRHQAIKDAVQTAVEAQPGWSAVQEFTGGERGQRWRADVLATAPTGRRIAWEVQVSRKQHADALRQVERMSAAGVEACYLDLTHRLARPIPAVHLDRGGATVVDESVPDAWRAASWVWRDYGVIDEGAWRLHHHPLAHFVAGVATRALDWDGDHWTTTAHREAEQASRQHWLAMHAQASVQEAARRAADERARRREQEAREAYEARVRLLRARMYRTDGEVARQARDNLAQQRAALDRQTAEIEQERQRSLAESAAERARIAAEQERASQAAAAAREAFRAQPCDRCGRSAVDRGDDTWPPLIAIEGGSVYLCEPCTHCTECDQKMFLLRRDRTLCERCRKARGMELDMWRLNTVTPRLTGLLDSAC